MYSFTHAFGEYLLKKHEAWCCGYDGQLVGTVPALQTPYSKESKTEVTSTCIAVRSVGDSKDTHRCCGTTGKSYLPQCGRQGRF